MVAKTKNRWGNAHFAFSFGCHLRSPAGHDIRCSLCWFPVDNAGWGSVGMPATKLVWSFVHLTSFLFLTAVC